MAPRQQDVHDPQVLCVYCLIEAANSAEPGQMELDFEPTPTVIFYGMSYCPGHFLDMMDTLDTENGFYLPRDN